MPAMHEIEYEIHGDDIQFVEVILESNEAVVAEAGGVIYMEVGVEMETIFRRRFPDGLQDGGAVLTGDVKRLLTGEPA